jgi:hypothetical protein
LSSSLEDGVTALTGDVPAATNTNAEMTTRDLRTTFLLIIKSCHFGKEFSQNEWSENKALSRLHWFALCNRQSFFESTPVFREKLR